MNWFEKILFLINSILAFLLALSYMLPYSPPKIFGVFSVLSLVVPVLLVLNILFAIYWLLRFKKQALLSIIILAFGISHLESLYKFGGTTTVDKTAPLTLISYNVRQFDRFGWLGKKGEIAAKIMDFVKDKDPTVLCFQEYYYSPDVDFSNFKYKYIDFNNNTNEVGQAIYSQFPIIHQGTLQFENTANNVIFADLKQEKDTIRLYNVHLQSHKINTNPKELQKEVSEKLLRRVSGSFAKQQRQVEKVIAHMKNSPYRNIVVGDFNNTAYSYIYKEFINAGLQDAFKMAGSGFGKTYDFRFFPTRIDYMFADHTMEVEYFENYSFPLSDHYPIFAGFTP